jgi:hypothetical protein
LDLLMVQVVLVREGCLADLPSEVLGRRSKLLIVTHQLLLLRLCLLKVGGNLGLSEGLVLHDVCLRHWLFDLCWCLLLLGGQAHTLDTDALRLLGLLTSGVLDGCLATTNCSNLLLGCCDLSLLLSRLRLAHGRRRCLTSLLLPFTDASLGIFFLALLLFLVYGDALLDVSFQAAAQVDWKLGQLESYLVVVVSLGVLFDYFNNAFALYRGQAVDLANQVVSLLNSERLIV